MTAPTPPECDPERQETVARWLARREDRVPYDAASEHHRAAWHRDARDLLAALPPSPGCGDLSPSINFGGDSDAERLMCELPVGHSGAHQHDNGDGLPPTRWVVRGPSPAEEAGRALVAVSQWINAGNAHRDPESVLWSRVLKVTEEAGEVFTALSGTIGENPRKGVTHTMDDVVDELLDTASAALAAVEHIRGHDGQAFPLLADKIRRVHARAALASPTPAPQGESVCIHGHAEDDAHVCGEPR